MFGLFKKTSWKLEGKSLSFFHSLFSQLPNKYAFLLQGLERGLYRKYSVNYSMQGSHYYLVFDPSQSDRSMTKGLQFELKNIQVKERNQLHSLNLIVSDGLWCGFEFDKDIIKLESYSFDVSLLQEVLFGNKKLTSVVGDLKSESLDLTDLSEIEVNGKHYYQIKDLQDGNYICIDSSGKVFGLIHDPYEIELINNNLKEFVEKVNTGQFNFDNYLESKTKTTKPNPS